MVFSNKAADLLDHARRDFGCDQTTNLSTVCGSLQDDCSRPNDRRAVSLENHKIEIISIAGCRETRLSEFYVMRPD